MRLPLSIIFGLFISLNAYNQRVSGPTVDHNEVSRNLDFEGQLVFYDGFEQGNIGESPQGWQSFSPSGEAFYIGTAGDAPSQANENGFWPVPLHGIFAMTNDDVCNCDKSNDRLISKSFNFRNYEDLQIGFSAFQNGSGGQTAVLQVKTSSVPWTNLINIPASAKWEDHRIFIPEIFLAPGFQFRFVYSDNNTYASGLAIDDVFIGISSESNIELKEAYAINGNDGHFADFYELIPKSQAPYANFRFGASILNESIDLANVSLLSDVAGPVGFSDSVGDWNLNPFQTDTLFFSLNQVFSPVDSGTYVLRNQISTDSTDDLSTDNERTAEFKVSENSYQRHRGQSDGTGIWLQNNLDRLGLVYHLFRDDTIKHVNVLIHPACEEGSRLKIKVYNFDTLTSSIFFTPTIIVEENDLGDTIQIPINLGLSADKYLFVIERESGDLVIGSSQNKKAVGRNVLFQPTGQSWRPFPYIPFLSLNIPAPQPCSDFILSDVEHVSCSGGNDGNIEVSLANGTATNYAWSNNNGNQSTASNLNAGNYTITITDSDGCVYTRKVRIEEPDSLAFLIHKAIDTCSQGVGSLSIQAFGGTEPYQYTWSDGSVSSKLMNLNSGIYSLTLTDRFGCEIDTTINLEGSSIFNVAYYIERPGCQDSNGLIAPDVLGGSSTFSYLWSTGDTTDTISDLKSGVYSITITDSLYCAQTGVVILNDSNSADLVFSNEEDILCFGEATGLLRVSANGTGPFLYKWSNGSFSDSISGISSGTYTVSVTDFINCQSVLQATLEDLGKPLNVHANGSGIQCFGDTSGLIQVFANGGDQPYDISWSNGSSSELQTQVLPGSYIVSVTDNLGCTAMDSVSIESLPVYISRIDSINYIDDTLAIPNGAIFTSTAGGTPPYRYLWNTGKELPNLTKLDSGFYSLTITDQLGCVNIIEQLITVIPLGKSEFKSKPEFSIYPNPVQSGHELNLNYDGLLERAFLIDMQGRKIPLITGDNLRSFNIPVGLSGIHLIVVETENGHWFYKELMIVH